MHTPTTSEVRSGQARYAALCRGFRAGEITQDQLDAAREALEEARSRARLDACIAEITAVVSLLTDAQRIALADLLADT